MKKNTQVKMVNCVMLFLALNAFVFSSMAFALRLPATPKTFEVLVAPTVGDQAVYRSDDVTFTIDVTGCGVVSNYSWTVNGFVVSAGPTETTLTLPNVLAALDNAVIICTITNESGTLDSNPATLLAFTAPTKNVLCNGESVAATPTGYKANIGSHAGDPVTWSYLVTPTDVRDTAGPLITDIQWTMDGGIMAGETNATMVLEPVQVADAANTPGYDVDIDISAQLP